MEDCDTYKKMIKKNETKSDSDSSRDSKHVTVDTDKLKKGMVALFPSSDFDTNDLAEVLAAAMVGVE